MNIQFSGNLENKKQLCGVTENIALPMLRSGCEVDCVDTEIEQNVFKVPQKKKKCDKSQASNRRQKVTANCLTPVWFFWSKVQ